MHALELLRLSLKQHSDAALSRLGKSDSSGIRSEVAKLKSWLGEGSGVKKPSVDRVAEALNAFQQDQKVSDSPQARLLCFGLTQAFGSGNYRVIENRELLFKLLDYLHPLRERPRLFRRFFRGLLLSYFSYDGNAPGLNPLFKENWQSLRGFLRFQLANAKTEGTDPEWLTTLLEHENLLGDRPCERYGLDALKGDQAGFDAMCKRIEIGADSWLVRALLFAQIDAAICAPDDNFKSFINRLVERLKALLLHAAVGLTKILDRYATCSSREPHPALQEFALAEWGNPWLKNTGLSWQRCSDAARKMVTNWVKRHLLRQFFSILSDDGAANTRRLDFWELYCEDVQGMWFALGPAAFKGKNSSFKKFKDDAEGAWLRLEDGAANLHAFVVRIGDQFAVEFSLHGNSAYFSHALNGESPYALSGVSIEVGSPSTGAGLKGRGNRLVHRDGANSCWENRFAQKLKMTDSALVEFCRKWRCKCERPTQFGAHIWVTSNAGTQLSMEQYSVLFGWGFQWSERKNAFYLEQN